MHIADILSSDNILFSQETYSKKTVLEEISKLLINTEPLLDYKKIFDCLVSREKLGSTGLGEGIAIPHGRLRNHHKPLAAFMQLKTGVDYDAIDEKPVDLLFALLVPEDSAEQHLEILSHLAQMFSDREIVQQLRTARTANEIYKTLPS